MKKTLLWIMGTILTAIVLFYLVLFLTRWRR